jgi:uncharacterized membrane protein (UPF0127 family)
MLFSPKEVKPLKKWHYIFFAVLILLFIGIKAYSYYWPKTTININGRILTVLLADTEQNRFKGWSGKKDMGKYDGMLFVFPEKAQHTMVMRNMNFPLDIIWIDGFTIVDMAPNLQPEPGRAEEELTPYFARLPSTLVLEVPAGFVTQNKLKIGDRIEIIN